MTTMKRKWNYAPVLLGAILTITAPNARAEDEVSQDPNQVRSQEQQLKAHNQALDQQYKLPPSYQGKYYPNDETAIGYHGTSNTSQNDAGRNGSYYYYYY